MTWFKVDDSFYTHPKVMSIPRGAARLRAIGLWTSAGTWCAAHLTDGFVPGPMVIEHGGTRGDAKHLVNAELWHAVDGGFQFNNWEEYQPTKAEIEAQRITRAEAGRAGGRMSGQSRRRSKAEATAKQVLQESLPVASYTVEPPYPTRTRTRSSVAGVVLPFGEKSIHRSGLSSASDPTMDGRSAASDIEASR